MMLWKNILLVAAGGSLGAVVRFVVNRLINTQHAGHFPLGTFIVNIAGCFIIGLLYGLSVRNIQLSEEMKLLLMTGFCGGFTTFSAFTVEGLMLLQENRFMVFLLYFTLSVVLGLTATFLGFQATR